MEQFMHKEAIIAVRVGGASYGTVYVGKIVNIDGDFVEIAYDPTKKMNKFRHASNSTGRALVNKRYLLYVELL